MPLPATAKREKKSWAGEKKSRDKEVRVNSTVGRGDDENLQTDRSTCRIVQSAIVSDLASVRDWPALRHDEGDSDETLNMRRSLPFFF